MDPSPLAPGSTGSGSGSGPLPPLPDWVLWLQAGFTALVAVLFVALLVQTRQQASRVQELQQRLQGLENSRAVERTTGLEDQLRNAVERLQALERDSSRLDVLQAETDALGAQLRQLSRPAAAPPAPPAAPGPERRGTEGSSPGPGLAPAEPGPWMQPGGTQP
jgi:TolA-binding protein